MPARNLGKAECEALLARAFFGRLGTSHEGQPYVVPVLFAFVAGRIYIHSRPSGLKIEYLERNPRVCFEVDEVAGLETAERLCAYAVRYRSVVALGAAYLLEDEAAKERALGHLIAKYAPDHVGEMPAREETVRVAVIEMMIDALSGKERV